MEMTTEEGQRIITMRPSMKRVLGGQRKCIAEFDSGYVFVNTEGKLGSPMN
jgi:hypothetical protein